LQKEDPEHIGSILKQLFHNSGWDNQLKASLPLLRWQDLVGLEIARQSQPEFLKDGVLQVRVENSVWLSHLRFLEGQLIQILNKELPSLEIKEIRFRQGPLEADQQLLSSSRSETAPSMRAEVVSDRPLSPDQLKLLETVKDPDLRRDLEALLKKRREYPET
jgi:predicted nucleic acid-binding Zn ribbon protein